jgi:hypothetical protein
MRGDTEHLQRTQAKLVGAASIDIASVRYPDGSIQVPADGARVTAGQQLAFDVVVRNLLVGHRFPGGVLDMHDTWIEVAVKDAAGKTIAQSGQHHETDPRDTEAHVLKSLIANKDGQLLHSRFQSLDRQPHGGPARSTGDPLRHDRTNNDATCAISIGYHG